MVKIKQANIPQTAPSLFIVFEKIPIRIAGKRVAAANPKANATSWATKAGG